MDVNKRCEQLARVTAQRAHADAAHKLALRSRHNAELVALLGPSCNKVAPPDMRRRWDAEKAALSSEALRVAGLCVLPG